MRVPALFLVVLIGVAGASGVASAEKVKTNQTTAVLARPGERGKVLLTVKEGQAMTVLSKDGRWLKVRVQGRTGYVPRSKVDLPDDDGRIGRVSRRRPFVDGRGTHRGSLGGEGPDDRVGADATGDNTPADDTGDDTGGGDDNGKGKGKGKGDKGKGDKGKGKGSADDGGDDTGDDTAEATDTGKGKGKGKGDKGKGKGDKGDKGDAGDDTGGDDTVTVADDTGDNDKRAKTHVSDADTKIYNEPDKTSGESFTAAPDQILYIEDKKGKWTQVSLAEGDIGWVQTDQLDLQTSGGEGSGVTTRVIHARGRLGVGFIQLATRTAGGPITPPDNFNVASEAAGMALGGDVAMPYKEKYVVGADLGYMYEKAFPGQAFNGQTTKFSVHQVDVRLIGGLDMKKSNGLTILGRLGYRYQSFLVANVTDLTKNNMMIPSEVFKSPVIGAGVNIPRLTPKIGIKANLDFAGIGGSLKQTKNLADGVSPAMKQFLVGGVFTYAWKPGMDLYATYDLTFGSASFGAEDPNSLRMHGGTATTRTDLFHTLGFGVTRQF